MFLLTKEQQKLRAELREFVDHEVCPVATELDNRGGFPHELYARIGKMGYLDAEFEYIGSGAKYGSLEGAIIIEELSRGLASLGLIVSPHYQCTELIACCGTETLKKRSSSRRAAASSSLHLPYLRSAADPMRWAWTPLL